MGTLERDPTLPGLPVEVRSLSSQSCPMARGFVSVIRQGLQFLSLTPEVQTPALTLTSSMILGKLFRLS